ncbi:hypothetical protein GUJ93_ZPchr0003g17169 [Zizania palustris]|uniref:Secreted protein n=1 Tax=Zizania palustris TaxID=103762 RepID=A0A8J5RY88_ZIZPA|nr:hypothetical protein GUJ93_ZPchr0003g17169 [Zizania palustris]
MRAFLHGRCALGRALLGLAHVSGPMAPGVCAPDHDISLPVESQLVLELELWELGAEWGDIFPCGRHS